MSITGTGSANDIEVDMRGVIFRAMGCSPLRANAATTTTASEKRTNATIGSHQTSSSQSTTPPCPLQTAASLVPPSSILLPLKPDTTDNNYQRLTPGQVVLAVR